MMRPRKYRSHTEWAEIFQHYVKSGLASKEYCQQHSLDYMYFLKRKRAFDGEQSISTKQDAFIKLKPPAQLKATPSTSLILHYQNTQLHIADGTDTQWLAGLLKALS